jgi:hypothetical protein
LWVDNPVHGPEAAQHDTNGRFVLVFEPSWRFGANGPSLPERFGLRITHGRRGERMADATSSEWRRLIAWLNGQSSDVAPPVKSSPCRSQVSDAAKTLAQDKSAHCSGVAKRDKRN